MKIIFLDIDGVLNSPSNEVYDFLLLLPFLAKKLEDDIRKKDGITCCVDKTYHILYSHLKDLLVIKMI